MEVLVEMLPWRQAMALALYAPDGFFRRPADPGGGGGHFRTSAHASDLFAVAILRLLAAVDEALARPDPFQVVDIGAGSGQLLRRLAELAPAPLARRFALRAVEVAPRPAGLPDHIGWADTLPPPGSITGAALATEWLDTVPLDVAEVDQHGQPRLLLVSPASGAEVAGGELSPSDAAWAHLWWADPPAGARIELGATRDTAWATAVATLARGVALTVDYGHMRYARPPHGTLTGFRAGREVAPVPDGSCDITAHVAMDAVRAAGEAIAGPPALLTTQREALGALGLSARRPPLDLASQDPAGYVRSLAAASQAAELMDPTGLGGHYWVIQPVGLPAGWIPAGIGTKHPG